METWNIRQLNGYELFWSSAAFLCVTRQRPGHCWMTDARCVKTSNALLKYLKLNPTWPNMPQLKLANIRVIFIDFQNFACCQKYLKDNKPNILHFSGLWSVVIFEGNWLPIFNIFIFKPRSHVVKFLGTANSAMHFQY